MKTTRRAFIQKTAIGSTGILLGGIGLSTSGCGNINGKKDNKKCSILFKNGEAKIKIGNEVFDPMAFRSFRPEAYNIRDFYNAGVRLMGIIPCRHALFVWECPILNMVSIGTG